MNASAFQHTRDHYQRENRRENCAGGFSHGDTVPGTTDLDSVAPCALVPTLHYGEVPARIEFNDQYCRTSYFL